MAQLRKDSEMVKSELGMSLIEVMISSAIVVVALTGMTQIFLSVREQTVKLTKERGKSIEIRNVVASLFANTSHYKINFDPDPDAPCKELDKGLPLAWDGTTLTDVADCKPNCPQGRVGFVMQPFPNKGLRGVYLVTLRISHPVETHGSSGFCLGSINSQELQFLMSLK